MAVVQESPSSTSVTDNGRKAGDAIVPIPKCGAPQKEDETPHVSDRCEDGSLKSYFRIFRYTDHIGWWTHAAALTCMIASGVLLPLMDLVFGKFVTVFNNFITSKATPAEFRSSLNDYTLYFVYLFIAKLVLVYIWTTLASTNAIRITRSLRIDFLKQTIRQEVAFFDLPEAGSISSHLTTNANLVNQGISEKLGLAIQAIATFFAAFVVAFAVQWKLTLITICIVPVIVIVTGICMGIDAKQENEIMIINSRAAKLAEEVFASVKTAHAFWAFPKLSGKYAAILDEAKAVGARKSPNYAVLFSVEFFCVYAGYGLAFWQGIRMYKEGEVSEPGQIVTVIFAVLLAAQALTQIAPQSVVISKAAAAAHQMFQVIDRESKIDSLSEEGIKPAECRGNIELQDVVFAYPSRPNIKVLQNFSLTIPANRTTAIVGFSGSGKSSVLGLLERWGCPESGTITLDGRKIEEYNLQWLRTKVRLVQQEPVMLEGTVFQNVVNGLAGTSMADLSDEEKQRLVEDACRAAYAHEFIEKLPEGYQTQIGQRGSMLSGGQKQRLAIARSVIANPRILLLDEATSALDPNAEQIVQKALNNVAVGRTMIVIAHRLSTIRNADNIVVMSNGRLIEQGTHDQLVALGGTYSHLVRIQHLGQEPDDDDEPQKDTRAEIGGAVIANTTSNVVEAVPDASAMEEGAAKKDDINLLRCLFILMREQRVLWPAFCWVGICCLAGGATYPALAIIFSRIMDAFALEGDKMVERGNFFSLMFFIVAVGNLVAYAVLGWFCNVIAQQMVRFYRYTIFDCVVRQDMTFFDMPGNSPGALVSHLSKEPESLHELLSMNMGVIAIVVVNLLSSCILAVVIGWKLGLTLVFGALPPLVFSGYLRIRLEIKLDDDTSDRFADSTGIASEAIMAIRTISSLAMERQILDRYENKLRSIAATSVKSLTWTMVWYALSQSISFLSMALGFWYGGRLVSFGEYTVTQFYTVFIAVIFSGEAAATFFTYTTSITKAQHAANFIFRLRDSVRPENKDDHPPDAEKRSNGAVSMDCQALEFSYPLRPSARVLKGVSISIPPGQLVALVGASGSGKSSLISVFERFYDPSSGTIFFDGEDYQKIHLGRYRANIALVQQEPVLYQGSIRENIAMGVLDATVSDEQILEACRQANIDSFIASLPEGLATPCGSQGLQFSGGQRQRIAIARALVRKPRLLLLDEATSALDTESERVVQAALDAAAKGEGGADGDGIEGNAKGRKRTTVAVAHRLSTIKGADKIFVFSYGRIAEAGTHEELLEMRGMYYEMCLGQSLDG
ncbi:P-loop containing nucleoside triphosphate hydrolase protein [Neurospora hispaniola]|uniref:P-loop containing nucleoside triphosphate hydrolase protein n=1 Tax=Neurospora hispaniola TaxID=588809 RepID=A0AAJ0I3V2_9PEZI|nr:P-loop containing nucleoside triphosphate hydrolase protein [Neurospora hispaniola]